MEKDKSEGLDLYLKDIEWTDLLNQKNFCGDLLVWQLGRTA